jgi:uncharacterized damage-inducible protein DinB
MNANEIIILNFEEIRRRSIKLWSGIPAEKYNWKPDEGAMSMLEMVRHVLEGEHWFHQIVHNRGTVNFTSPWKELPYTDIEAEIVFAKPYREKFIADILNFTAADLENIEIYRPEKNQRRKLGDYLLRIGYHESVHTGQLLNYMRTAGIERPLIWD